jgi:predicted phage baseplate assembly protein
MWTLNLDQAPMFPREDFDEAAPRVTVYGNLVGATQGKTLAETPIGSGDARQTFQTFALPKAPLTYLLDVSQTPAQSPELTVYVGDTAWTRVDTLFDTAPDAQVYVVREDAAGTSYVQFGDGKTGARLASGRNNVVAVYRTGSGAHGALKADTTPQASGKLNGLDKVYLPQPITTGAAPESEDNAREAAPARVQSLGRLVSVADFEAEALALPHVIKATAAWAAPEGVPLVQLTVLTESESEADLAAVAGALATSNRARGASRFPISVARGLRQYLAISLTAGYDATRREEDVKADIARALGVAGSEADGIDGSRGLFGLHGLRFGQSAHVSQIIAAAQQVQGVVWVTLQSAQIVPLGNPVETDPAKLIAPAVDAVPAQSIACGDTFILALYAAHLTVNIASA